MIQNVINKTAEKSSSILKSDFVQTAAGLVICISVDMAMNALLGARMPYSTGWKRAMRKLGVLVLSMKIADETEAYFHKVCDDTRETIDNFKNGGRT